MCAPALHSGKWKRGKGSITRLNVGRWEGGGGRRREAEPMAIIDGLPPKT